MDILIAVLIQQLVLITAALAQVMLKRAAAIKRSSPLLDYLNPRVIGAYFILFCTTFPTIYVFRFLPLTTGVVLGSTGYIYVTLMGAHFFNETINRRKIFALATIVLGVIVFSLS